MNRVKNSTWDYVILFVFYFLGEIAGTGKEFLSLDFLFITLYSAFFSFVLYLVIQLISYLLAAENTKNSTHEKASVNTANNKENNNRGELAFAIFILLCVVVFIVFTNLGEVLQLTGYIIVFFRVLNRKKYWDN